MPGTPSTDISTDAHHFIGLSRCRNRTWSPARGRSFASSRPRTPDRTASRRGATSPCTSEETKKTVPMTIHSFPTMTISITDPDTLEEFGLDQPVTFDLAAPVKKVEGMLEEGKQILKLFEKIYGPYPYDELHIAQMAPQLEFGQSPQGFVQLSGAAFLSQATTLSDFIHGFLSHEFAHQWWAHQVGWASGDDEWLSESFAEYGSGIFVNAYQGR